MAVLDEATVSVVGVESVGVGSSDIATPAGPKWIGDVEEMVMYT